MRGDYFLLSPARLSHHTSEFADEYERFGLSSLSLRDLGDLLLHSDARKNREILRKCSAHRRRRAGDARGSIP